MDIDTILINKQTCTDRDVNGLFVELGQLNGDALKRIEGVRLRPTSGTTEGRSVLRLEYALDERVVAPFVVLQRFRSYHLVRTSRGLKSQIFQILLI